MGARKPLEPPPAVADRAVPLRFVDFAIRAWREGPYLQVIAHSTPAGGMRQPIAVRLGAFGADEYRVPATATLAHGAELGRRLARLLLPDDVWRMLGESLRIVAPHSDLGLRLRLCLDDDLIDLPWEFLYRRDVDAQTAWGGFLLMDGRVSLVREPPSIVDAPAESDRTQHGIFVGTMFDNAADEWGVGIEYDSLARSLHPLKNLIDLHFTRADASDEVDRAIARGCDLFHYAGHTHVQDGRGVMVQLASAEAINGVLTSETPHDLEALSHRAEWAWSDTLAVRLAKAGTRLAVFNACNSGFWPFVRPFMRAGIPAVIGVQGTVSNAAALDFAEKLYQSLAVGLSIDEALTYARLSVASSRRGSCDCDWARFMAYMPTDSAVLFPRSEASGMRRRQATVRKQRAETLQNIAGHLDGEGVSRMLSDVAAASVLILGRFTTERKAILDALRAQLSLPPRRYIPIVFDFAQPDDRTLIGSILRFASVSRFIIADLSDPKSVPAELQAIVPQFPNVPVVPIIEATQREYPVSDDILSRQSVTPVVPYQDKSHLLAILDAQILGPAEKLRAELNPRASK